MARGDDNYRRVLDVLPVAVYVTDTAGRVTYYNDAAAALWGRRPDLGTSMWCGSWKLYTLDGQELPHDKCPMAVALRERRRIQGREAVAERPDGSRVPFMSSPTPLYDELGQFTGAVNVLLDIGDRKLAGVHAQRLSSIIESSDDAIVSKDLNGIIETWNQGAERLFGYTADEAIGKPILILLPPDRIGEEAEILACLRRGDRVDHFETVRRHKNGSLLEISLTISPIKDADGRVIGASKIARDITERKRAQEQQMLLVREMKHRLRNMLTIVQAIASQTLRSASSDDRAAFAGRLQTLAAAQDLLTIENWKHAPLRDVVARALAAFQGERRQRIDIQDSDDDVRLDGGKISTVIMALHELATNAVKYGALSNATGRVRIRWEVRSGAEQAYVLLHWQESGGPPVVQPAHKGFGSLLLERAIDGNSGMARLTFHPQGVECILELEVAS
jgi:PAS domain S-box-containing protein